MKRILSLLLALSMMVSLLPVVSATEQETEYTSPGITLNYDISGTIRKYIEEGAVIHGKDSFAGLGYKAFTYDTTDGFFTYAANRTKEIYSWDEGGYNYPVTLTRDVTKIRNFDAAAGIQYLSQYVTNEGIFNSWLALKIKVPVSGTYMPKVTYAKYNKDGETKLDYFLVKDDGSEMSELLAEANLTTEAEGYIGSKDCEDINLGNASQKIVVDEALGNEPLNLDEGEYYLVYKPRVVKKATNWTGNYSFVSNFTLDGGNTAAAVPMGATVSCDSARLFDGGDTAQLSVMLFMSNKTKKEATNVKYKALTPEFATVDENTGIITGVKPGKAEFEVTATENGREYKATLSLTVYDSRLAGITVKYDVSAMVKKFSAEGKSIHGADSFDGLGYNVYTYDTTNGFFTYAANKTKDIYSWDEAGYDYSVTLTRDVTKMRNFDTAAGLQFLSQYVTKEGIFNSWFALKIKVPVSGVYTPKVTYAKYKKDGDTKLDYFLIKDDGSEMSELLSEANLTTASAGYIGSKSCEDLTQKGSQTIIVNEAFDDPVNLDEGEYYLVYKPRVVKNATNWEGNYSFASDFTLDGGNIKDPEPMMARFHSDKETIYSNGGTAKVSATVYLSDGTTTEVENVTVTSLTDFAEVNNTFGVIIGRENGIAKFRAEVNYAGKIFSSDEMEIEVVENPVQPGEGCLIYYDIATWLGNAEGAGDGAESFGGLGYKAMTYETTDGTFAYAANKTSGKYSWNEDGIHYSTYSASSDSRFRIGEGERFSGLQMYVTSNGWWALKVKVKEAGLYMPAATYWAYNRPGESYMDYFLIKNDGTEMSTLLADANLKPQSPGYIGSKRNEKEISGSSSSQAFVYDEPFESPVQLDEGEYYLVYKPRAVAGSSMYAVASNFSLDGVNCIKSLIADVKTDLNTGDKEKINIFPTRLDGTVIDADDLRITYETSNRNVLTVDSDGVVNAVGDGVATVTVTVNDGTGEISKKLEFSVYDNSGVADIILNLKDKLYVNQAVLLDADAVMNSGNVIDIPEESITCEIEDESILSYSDGVVTALSEGKSGISVKIDFRGETPGYENEITVVPATGKTAPTIYTYEQRQNAVNNAKKYDWAAKTVKAYAAAGDKAIEWVEAVFPQILGEGIPRGRQIGLPGDDRYVFCRYCRKRIGAGDSLTYDFVSRPWKVQCPDCKRLFPSNNFEGFLKLGLDSKGFFDVDRARQAHHEMLFHEDGSECTCEKPKAANTPEWYIFYGYGNSKGYLYNELYKEIRDSNEDPWGDKITWNKDKDGNDLGADLGTYKDPQTGEVLWKGGDMWGVDDGWGYLPGRKYADDGNIQERHGYIAYYFYSFWMTIYGYVEDISEAYIYTSDPKYGRAGIILLDRIADVWPHFSSYYFKDLFLNTSGGNGSGAATGRINDNHLGRRFAYAADAFFPMINDPEVMKRLSADAAERGLDNPKTSSDLIWRNIADGILVATADMCMDGRINGNFGQPQAVAAIAAIALDEQPKTDEIIDWLYRPTGPSSGNQPIKGGNVEGKIMNEVDRDGMGNESAPRYNVGWIANLRLFADELCKYEGDMEYNPYENPKFLKMFEVPADILLTYSKHPNIGDSGSSASAGLNGAVGTWYNAFTKTTNEHYKKKFAQYIWYFAKGNVKQFGNDIFSENPAGAEEELLRYIDKDAKLESLMLTGYGFAALRDGYNYKSANAQTAINNSRDFWMWFGRNGSHSHMDALNIGIDAFGLDVAPDLGYPEDTSYTPNRLQWVNATISHNTVIVDEKNQNGWSTPHGFPMHFDDSGKVKLMDADMKEAYKQTDNYRRTIVMVQANDDVSYGIDFFRITGGKHHLYSFHSQAQNAYPVSGLDGLTPDPVVQDKDGKDIVGSYAGPEAAYGMDPNSPNAWDYETVYPRGYTWMKNVRRDKSPETQFTVEFDVQDYRKVLQDGKGIKLRMTQINDFAPTEVAIAAGYMTQKSETKQMPETLDYVLVERDGGENELDTLFTTVYEPYRNNPYIEEISAVDVRIKTGTEADGDMARAVKVKHTQANGGNTDYVVYATNNDVVYTVSDGDFNFDFSGFVGVYTLNANGAVIYRYVNDGTIIGKETGKVSEYTGTVVNFQKENAFENYIDVEIDCTELYDLTEKYIYVNNDGVENGVYRIVSATDEAEGLREGCVRLDLGTVTLIRGHIDKQDLDKGYEYNIKEGQTFSIPTSFVDESVPEFDSVSDSLSVSAGSSITVTVHASSPIKEDAPTITYIGTALPRGASLNAATGVFTWKPDSSQVGDNHVAITARDSDGREATIHFDITVYGSTTGGSSSDKTDENGKTESPGTGTADAPTGGGGGGGGGGAAPTDKPEDTTNTDKTDEKTSGENQEDEGNTDNTDTENAPVRFIDLDNHAWAQDAINELAENKIIKGTSASTFAPANNITRADFALLLVRAFDLESENTENFADVSASDYFASELAIARNNGIVGGIGDNKYAPRNNITRQDMMVIVYRALQAISVAIGDSSPEERAELEGYPDSDVVADYAKEAVSALVGAGFVNGKNGRIAPTDYTTRAEVAVLIKRILDYTKNK